MKLKNKEWYEVVLCSGCLCRFQFMSMVVVDNETYCFRCVRAKKKPKTVSEKKPKPEKVKVPKDKEPVLKTDGKEWYAIQIYGNDTACAKRILKNAKSQDLGHLITRAIVPRVREQHIQKSGKVVFRNKKAMPGYLLVRCQLTPAVENCIKKVKGAVDTRWIEEQEDGTKVEHKGSKSYSVVRILPYEKEFKFEDTLKDGFHFVKPVPIEQEAVERFAHKPKASKQKINYDINDYVLITEGVYKGVKGHVVEMKEPLTEGGKTLVKFRLLGVNTEQWFSSHILTKTI